MTAAFNLSQLANNLNTSGQLDATDGLTGAVPVANGGTGSTTAAGARSNLGTNDAANITTGTIATARLGSGTANSTTFLRGDQTWATAGGTPSTTDVLNAYAGASAGAIGTYSWLITASSVSPGTLFASTGSTIAGSSLRYSSLNNSGGTQGIGFSFGNASSGTPSGTWRCMGYAYNPDGEGSRSIVTLYLRIS